MILSVKRTSTSSGIALLTTYFCKISGTRMTVPESGT